MRIIRRLLPLCVSRSRWPGAGIAAAQTVAIDTDDIGGIVNGPAGPEAGVWVIAETDDFDTRYAKIVVTDDQGRYVVPDLPAANYRVWVRGYGLVDSAKDAGRPGQALNLVANAAPSPAAAAVVYPAAYWYSMMKVPKAAEVSSLPGGVNQYLASVKNLSCIGCHQIGQLATRTLPPEFPSMSHHDAWVRRIQSGQAGSADARVRDEPARRRTAEISRRLDRARRQGRAAARATAAAARRRAQHRRDRSRLVHRQSVHARPLRHGSPQPDGERLRQVVRRSGALDRRVPDSRPEDEYGDRDARAGAGPEHADDEQHSADTAAGVLGQRGDLGQQGQRAQPDAR